MSVSGSLNPGSNWSTAGTEAGVLHAPVGTGFGDDGDITINVTVNEHNNDTYNGDIKPFIVLMFADVC